MFVIMVKKHRNSICILSLLNVGYKHFSGWLFTYWCCWNWKPLSYLTYADILGQCVSQDRKVMALRW